jgi:hypothetical protein
VQTIIVSLIALAAAAFVARRVVRAVRPAKGQAACSSCECESSSEALRHSG